MYRTVFAAILCLISVGTFAAEFHVSTDGNDGNAGTSAAPFASLERARDAVRALKTTETLPEGGITVWIHGGVYSRLKSFRLEEQDSGAPECHIIYRAIEGEDVRLMGGVELPATAFMPVQDGAVLGRMEEHPRGHVLVASLKALGITDYGVFPDAYGDPPPVPELYFDGERMTLARWPNEDWAHIAKVIESGPAPWRNHQSDQPGTFQYEGDRPERWVSAPGVWL